MAGAPRSPTPADRLLTTAFYESPCAYARRSSSDALTESSTVGWVSRSVSQASNRVAISSSFNPSSRLGGEPRRRPTGHIRLNGLRALVLRAFLIGRHSFRHLVDPSVQPSGQAAG